ncbi:unnamed protein product [Linum grandiflorum]
MRGGGITGVCSKLIADILSRLQKQKQHQPTNSRIIISQQPPKTNSGEELTMRALTEVFGMQNDGKINTVKARRVVQKLGLLIDDTVINDEELVGVEELAMAMAKENGNSNSNTEEEVMMREAFRIFDEDGNGYIDAVELKRVLLCLGLDRGCWDLSDFNTMLNLVDLNSDGKVDFSEFQLMLTMTSSS